MSLLMRWHLCMCNGDILQVEIDESIDEMASYFSRESVPKVLITTSDRPSPVRLVYAVLHNIFVVGQISLKFWSYHALLDTNMTLCTQIMYDELL